MRTKWEACFGNLKTLPLYLSEEQGTSILECRHLVPSDKPKAALAMLHAFMDGVDLPDK